MFLFATHSDFSSIITLGGAQHIDSYSSPAGSSRGSSSYLTPSTDSSQVLVNMFVMSAYYYTSWSKTKASTKEKHNLQGRQMPKYVRPVSVLLRLALSNTKGTKDGVKWSEGPKNWALNDKIWDIFWITRVYRCGLRPLDPSVDIVLCLLPSGDQAARYMMFEG